MVIRSDGAVVPGGAMDFGSGRALGDAGRDNLLTLWKKSLAVAAHAEHHRSVPVDAGGTAREREAEMPAGAAP
jgi:hypothetical protein